MDLIFSRVHFVHVYWTVFYCPASLHWCCGDVMYICVNNCGSVSLVYCTVLGSVLSDDCRKLMAVDWVCESEYWCIEVLTFFFNGFASSSSLFYRAALHACSHLIVARSDVIQMSAVLMWHCYCGLLFDDMMFYCCLGNALHHKCYSLWQIFYINGVKCIVM